MYLFSVFVSQHFDYLFTGVDSAYSVIRAHNESVSWSQAKQVCDQQNMTLPTFKKTTLLQFTKRNQDFIRKDVWQDGRCAWNETSCLTGKCSNDIKLLTHCYEHVTKIKYLLWQKIWSCFKFKLWPKAIKKSRYRNSVTRYALHSLRAQTNKWMAMNGDCINELNFPH